MIGDEFRMQQHVAVDEHQVLGASRGNRQIAQARDAESVVRLRDQARGHRRTAP